MTVTDHETLERPFRQTRGELAGEIEAVLRRQIMLAGQVQAGGAVLSDDVANSILRLTQAYSTLTLSSNRPARA